MRASPGTPPAHILVVDDEAPITELLSTALRYLGYQVTVASGGATLVARLPLTASSQPTPGPV